jgi:SAM-dependent methyltransferase
MGIDLHNLHFLAHAQDLGASFERTIAIGRQAVFVDEQPLEDFRRLRGLPALHEPGWRAGTPRFFEPLASQWLGAEVADSVDASPYEQARFIHDMNQPWPTADALAAARGGYDAVIDFGCLEHVFDFPVAWRNVVDLCRVGGHVLHSLPANNLCGHGFYQFSPELFCNLYQASRGFELRGLFVAMKADVRQWWRVADPAQLQRRVKLSNSHETYLLVIARKLREPPAWSPPQQSDYAQGAWHDGAGGESHAAAGETGSVDAGLRGRVNAVLSVLGARDAARVWRARMQAIAHSGFDLPAPDYTRVDVAGLIRRSDR